MKDIQDIYLQELNNIIRRYAYEYWDMPAFITDAVIPKFKYEAHSTSNIKDILHKDLLDYITKRRDWKDPMYTHLDILDLKSVDPTSIYAEVITKGCDKMLILPDVFSSGRFQLTDSNPHMDMLQKNIVFFDNNILQLIQNTVQMVMVNYNTKCYVFWNSSTDPNKYMEFETLRVMGIDKVVSLCEGSYTGYHTNNPEKGFSLTLDINNKVVMDNSNKDVISFYIPMPFTVIDKSSELIDLPMPNPPIMDFNMSANVFMTSYQAPRSSGIKYFNGRNLLFTNMAIAINTTTREYKILDFSAEEYDFIEKIDKHTISIKNYDSYDTIIAFRKPFNYTNYSRIDTIYDEILQVSKSAIREMGTVKFNTNSIFYMFRDEDLLWEEIEDLMYNTDPHIAQLIGKSYPMVNTFHLTEGEIMAPKTVFKGIEFDGWCLKFTMHNPCKFRPVSWINGRMNTRDIQYVQDADNIHILLNTDAVFEFIKITIDRRYNDPVEITKMIKTTDVNLTVALFPLYDVLKREYVYSKYHPSSPLTKILNNYLMSAPAETISEDTMIFNNGFLTTLNQNDALVKSVDVISPYDYYIEDSNTEINHMQNDNRRMNSNTILLNRMINGYESGCRLILNNNYKFRESISMDDIELPKDTTLPIIPGRTLLFGSYGDLLIDEIGYEMLSLRCFRYRDLKLGVSPEQSIGINVNLVDIPNTNGSDNFIFPIDPKRFTAECLNREWSYNVMKNENIRRLFLQKDIKPLYEDLYTLVDIDTRKEMTAWSTYRLPTMDNPYDEDDYLATIDKYEDKEYIMDGTTLTPFPTFDAEDDSVLANFFNSTWDISLNTLLYRHRLALRHYERDNSYVLNKDAIVAPRIELLNPLVSLYDYWLKFPMETKSSSMQLEYKWYGKENRDISLEEYYAGDLATLNTNSTSEKTLY